MSFIGKSQGTGIHRHSQPVLKWRGGGGREASVEPLVSEHAGHMLDKSLSV